MNNYQLLCEHCGFKKLTNGTDLSGLREVKTSPLFMGTPKIDPATKKIAAPSAKQQCKKFKCPKCGYAIKAKCLGTINDQANPSYGSQAGSPGPSF